MAAVLAQGLDGPGRRVEAAPDYRACRGEGGRGPRGWPSFPVTVRVSGAHRPHAELGMCSPAGLPGPKLRGPKQVHTKPLVPPERIRGFVQNRLEFIFSFYIMIPCN